MDPVLPGESGARKAVAVVLAAGDGKRMRSDRPKVAHELLGRPMLLWTLDAAFEGGVDAAVVVVAPRHPEVQELVRDYASETGRLVKSAVQAQPQGTGDAARCALHEVESLRAQWGCALEQIDLMVAFGDTPGLSGLTLQGFLSFHRKQAAAATVLAFELADPTGYGRVLRDGGGAFKGIREEKDCTADERALSLCNSGFLCVCAAHAARVLPALGKQNAAGEYYLTDLPTLLAAEGKRVSVFAGADPEELHGVNSQEQLAAAACRLQQRILRRWMADGVQFLRPDLVVVGPEVRFGAGVVVEAFVHLTGALRIPDGARVRSGTGMGTGVGTCAV